MTEITRRQFLQLTANLTGLGLLAACQPITMPAAAVQPAADGTYTALFTEAKQRAIAALEEHQAPGMSAGVVKDGQLIYAEGFGLADVESAKPMTPQSVMGMASVSKTFTAAAIMQLMEAGKLRIESPVVEYLPYFRMADDRYRQITISQIMSHTSGLPSGIEGDGFLVGYDNPEYHEGAVEQWVRSLESQKLMDAPGGSFFYTDLGYSVLGDIIAKVSGEVFEDYIRQHLFTPLGMRHSTFRLEEIDPILYATPYAKDPASGKVVPNLVITYNRKWAPAAGLYSNVEDLSRWAMMNLAGGELDGQRVLQPESIKILWEHQSQTGWGGVLDNYGRGWWLGEFDARPIIITVGGMPGIQTTGALLVPDQSLAVIALGNYHEGWEMTPYASDFSIWLASKLIV